MGRFRSSYVIQHLVARRETTIQHAAIGRTRIASMIPMISVVFYVQSISRIRPFQLKCPVYETEKFRLLILCFESHRFCVAPMMNWTDRHCRIFHRRLTKRALLYTEMVTADAVIHGDRERLLGFSVEERPIALQLGGSDSAKLARAARIGADLGYDEINLNVGCPSDRVQEGRFGACLMAEPELVAVCVSAMRESQPAPVTVKCRIGINDQNAETDLTHFINVVSKTGCLTFIVHARKAWLKGLSPKENREVPPLDYQRVYLLKALHPNLTIIINGGIETIGDARTHLDHVDGVMLGRAAYKNPYILADVDRALFGEVLAAPVRCDALAGLLPYANRHVANGGRLSNITRHVLGLYHSQPRGRAFRRVLGEHGTQSSAAVDVLSDAIALAEHGVGRQEPPDTTWDDRTSVSEIST